MNSRFQIGLSKSRRAFSLVEMLVVIAIIGILASLAVNYLSAVNRETMTRVRDQRNAQEVASLTIGAEAVGAPVVEPGDMRGTIDNLMEGREATSGSFAGRKFRLGRLNEEEITGAMKYLDWQGNLPAYYTNGKPVPDDQP